MGNLIKIVFNNNVIYITSITLSVKDITINCNTNISTFIDLTDTLKLKIKLIASEIENVHVATTKPKQIIYYTITPIEKYISKIIKTINKLEKS